ncbi:MAG: hypothetical protein K2G93_01315 [Rikenella sp.]|nr:hypothetical protein [Rikenella sp.]
MEYNENDYDYNDYPRQESDSSTKGLKIAIIILLVILAAVTFLFWRQVQAEKAQNAELLVDKDTLTNRLSVLMGEMGDLKIDNDTMNIALMQQRHVADSLMDRLKKERSWNYSKIKKYERELGTLRSAMQGFVRQIDSLNRLNQLLAGENVRMKREMSTYRLRAEQAEEMNQELNNKVKRGSQLRAREVALLPYKNNKVTNKSKQVDKLVTEFVLAANELAVPGERTVYIRIIMPDSEILGSRDGGRFTFAGESIPYSAKRAVDYQGEDLPMSIYYEDVKGLYPGQYGVMVYVDGQMIGESEVVLR